MTTPHFFTYAVPEFSEHALELGRRLKEAGYQKVSADVNRRGWTFCIDEHVIDLEFTITGKSVTVTSLGGSRMIQRKRPSQEWPVDQIYRSLTYQHSRIVKLTEEQRKRQNKERSQEFVERLTKEFPDVDLVPEATAMLLATDCAPNHVKVLLNVLIDVEASVARSILTTFHTLMTQPHLRKKEA